MLAVNAAIPICNIERDGVTRDGQRGELYGADVDKADAGDFERRSRGNRHQFRFILSADDALELGDLAAFTRAHMKQVELDLCTRLDWVAVRPEEHTSGLPALMRITYAVLCLKQKKAREARTLQQY